MHGKIVSILMLGGAATLSGCITHKDHNPHNDVLIFGTTTKLGIDVSAPVQNGAVPEFTVGYKRLEAVWMPLKPQAETNTVTETVTLSGGQAGRGARTKPHTRTLATTQVIQRGDVPPPDLVRDKYVSVSSGVSPQKGGQALEIDTYSVFASLGAKGGLSFNSASGNLAQFFATGIAAQRLGTNASISEALNATAPEAAAKEAAAESATVQALLDAGATPEDASRLASTTVATQVQVNADVLKATGCVQAWNGTPPASLSAADNVSESQKRAIAQAQIIVSTSGSNANLAGDLRDNAAARAAILKACEKGN